MSKNAKVNTTVKIKCDSVDTARGVMSYLQTYGNDISRNINNMLAQMGRGKADTAFENVDMDKLTLNVNTNPTDKGDVITLVDGNLVVSSYTNLSNRDLYGVIADSGVTVFLFNSEGFDTALKTANTMAIVEDMLEKLPAIVEEQRIMVKQEQEARDAERESVEAEEDEAVNSFHKEV